MGGKVNVFSEDMLVLNGKIEAKGLNKDGGSLIVVSENSLYSTPKNSMDVS